MILQSLLSLLITTISSPQSSISLSVWIAKSQIFYISHSPALALVDARTVCLHIQFQISCTGVNVLFFQLCSVSSCIGFQIGRNTKWKHGWHFHFSPCRACIRGNTSWWSIQFFTVFVLSACSWAAYITLSVSRFNSPAFNHSHLIWSCTFFSQELTMQSFLFSYCLFFIFFVLLYSSHQSLFLVVPLQFQPSRVSHCCLQHNQRG